MTAARAFYEDEAICLIDVLIRDKFLRDDQDMGTRLSLPPRQLRKTLTFLQEEHLVKSEPVDDLNEGGSQATRFWYIDYNHAVNVIRLRIFLLRKKLEEEEMRARSSSLYLCPGYTTKTCNGRFTETEAQQIVDYETGLFLCQECTNAHAANPDPPPKDTYTLQLQDNTRVLRQAMDHIRRVNVQFSNKMVGNQQMRMGMYDLIQKVRSKQGASGNTGGSAGGSSGVGGGGAGSSSSAMVTSGVAPIPLTSNLPSENRMMHIGSTRIEGTGRTAGVKLKKAKEKMEKANAAMGNTNSATNNQIRKFLSGGSDDLTFLKNALGQQIAFEVEKGGGARANLLATGAGRSLEKLLDAASIRVGVELDIVTSLAMMHKRKREEEEMNQDEAAKKRREAQNATLLFLRNNIGRNDDDDGADADLKNDYDSGEDDEDDACIVIDAEDEWAEMKEDERRATFQAFYKKEKARLKALYVGDGGGAGGAAQSSQNGRAMQNGEDEDGIIIDPEDHTGAVAWEDGGD